jgi:hypothetical protein
MQEVHAQQEDYWRRIDQAAVNKNSSSYDEAVRLLVELREAADFYHESQAFQARYLSWVRSYLRRPALLERLQKRNFTVPKA